MDQCENEKLPGGPSLQRTPNFYGPYLEEHHQVFMVKSPSSLGLGKGKSNHCKLCSSLHFNKELFFGRNDFARAP